MEGHVGFGLGLWVPSLFALCLAAVLTLLGVVGMCARCFVAWCGWEEEALRAFEGLVSWFCWVGVWVSYLGSASPFVLVIAATSILHSGMSAIAAMGLRYVPMVGHKLVSCLGSGVFEGSESVSQGVSVGSDVAGAGQGVSKGVQSGLGSVASQGVVSGHKSGSGIAQVWVMGRSASVGSTGVVKVGCWSGMSLQGGLVVSLCAGFVPSSYVVLKGSVLAVVLGSGLVLGCG